MLVTVFAAVLLWYGLRGEPNSEPAIGTNRPAPDDLGTLGPGSDAPPYWPSAIISQQEEFRREADRRLRMMRRKRKR